MSKKRMEEVIKDILKDNTQKNALDFAAHLRAMELSLEESENYWDVKYKGKNVCFILINGADEAPGPWTIWSDQEPGTWITWGDANNQEHKDFLMDEYTKKIAWANVNYCASCGGNCSPGKRKKILGKEFDNLCSSAIAFTNPDAEAINCAKKMVEMRKKDILDSI